MRDEAGFRTFELIPLGNAPWTFVVVDREDYPYLSQFNWFVDRKGYALRSLPRNGGQSLKVRLHRELIGAKKGEIVDHINRDKLDNRKSNLRIVTPSQSCMNQGLRKDNQCGYRGVSYRKDSGKWRAWINIDHKRTHLGSYTTADEAALAYNVAAMKYFQEYAVLNEVKSYQNW